MLILKKGDKIFCFLANPKCGSTLLRNIILEKSIYKKNIIHKGLKKITDCRNDPNNINYNHCSIKGVINYLQNNNIDRENAIIVSTIRNPYSRVVSKYNWFLKMNKQKYYKINNDFNEDLKCFLIDDRNRWTNIHRPNSFRTYLNNKTDEVLRLENLAEDFEIFNKKYGFNFEFKNNIVNGNNYKKNITLNEDVKELIYTDYELDFIDGNYDK